ncbi:MAG: M24 family metallopeptidase [Halolamina sp.]
MASDRDLVDDRLAAAGVDGYLVDADGTDSHQLYLSGFDAPDPFLTLREPGETTVLVSGLEYGRAEAEADATVERLSAYGYRERVADYGRTEGRVRTYAAFLDAHDVDAVLTPERFPLHTADGLRDRGVSVAVDDEDVLSTARATKAETEIDHVREAQAANERAMAAAEALLAEATVRDGVLHHDGEILTSERVTREIEVTLLEAGCALDETIVACGADAADPHDRGSGPLEAGEPIVVDIFPRSKTTNYHSDMTRTFCRGEPTETVREWYDLTEQALAAALETVEAGATGAEVHAAACEVYEAAGLATLRSDPETETGFIHSTGHGVGLDVHEAPGLNPDGDELEAGHVVTVEPGLYDPEVGGIRIEDIAVVTEDGHENLTDYPVELTV